MRNNHPDILGLFPIEADRKYIGLVIMVLKRLFNAGAGRGLDTFGIVEIFRNGWPRKPTGRREFLHRPDLVTTHCAFFPIRSSHCSSGIFLSMRKIFDTEATAFVMSARQSPHNPARNTVISL